MAKGLGASLVPGEKGPKSPAESTQIGTLDQTLGPDPVRVHLSESGEVERIGRYEVTGVLGRGGMGVVYEVADREARQILALKTIETRFLALSESNADGRFRQEITVLGRLNHPGIVRLFDSGIARHPLGYDLAFFVMERLDGDTLDRELKSGKPFVLPEILGIVRQLAEALDYLQQNGVLHRDIKPANVFREIGGRVVLMDFGLARSAEFTRLTLAGQIVGTCAYMSPERLCGKTFEIAADVYAVGVVLFQLIAGHQPFTGTTATDMLESIKRGLPIPPRIHELSPNGALENLLRAMLAYKAEDRPTPRALVERVDHFLRTLVGDADETSRSDPRIPISSPRTPILEPSNPVVVPVSSDRLSDPMSSADRRGAPIRRPLDPTAPQRMAAEASSRLGDVELEARGPTWSFVGFLLAVSTTVAFVIGIVLGRVTATPPAQIVPVKTIIEVPAKPTAVAATPRVVEPSGTPSTDTPSRSADEDPPSSTRPPESFTSHRDAIEYAEQLLERRRFAEAIPILERARVLNPAYADTYRSFGDAYAGNDRIDEAIDNYKRYLALRPKAEDAYEVRKKLDRLDRRSR